jgi:hypothetical protein
MDPYLQVLHHLRFSRPRRPDRPDIARFGLKVHCVAAARRPGHHPSGLVHLDGPAKQPTVEVASVVASGASRFVPVSVNDISDDSPQALWPPQPAARGSLAFPSWLS